MFECNPCFETPPAHRPRLPTRGRRRGPTLHAPLLAALLSALGWGLGTTTAAAMQSSETAEGPTATAGSKASAGAAKGEAAKVDDPAQTPRSPHSFNPSVLYIQPGSYPSEASAGERYLEIRLHYRVDQHGLYKNQALRLGFGYPTPNHWSGRYQRFSGWLIGPSTSYTKLPFGDLQPTDPDQPNFVRVHCPEYPEIEFVTRIIHENSHVDLIEARPEQAVPAGAVIEFSMGDKSQGGAGLKFRNVPAHVFAVFFRKRDGSGLFSIDPRTAPRLLVTARRADNLLVNIPITPELGKAFPISILAMQGHEGPRGFLLRKTDFEGDLLLESIPEGALELPAEVHIGAGARGAARVFATVLEEGVVGVRVRRKDQPEVVALSNFAVAQQEPKYLYYAGDNQRHSIAGGHAAAPDDELWLQHYERGDDFATIVQHVSSDLASWRMANEIAKQFQKTIDPEEQHFVAFPGYEWSLRDRHHHVVYRSFNKAAALGDKPSPPNTGERAVRWLGNLEEFFAGLAKLNSAPLAIAHHTMWGQTYRGATPYDWGPKEHSNRRLLEIFSAHGASDRHYSKPYGPWDYAVHWDGRTDEQRQKVAGGSAQDALAAGYRLGFIGGSDNHSWAYYRSGRTSTGGWRNKCGRQGLGIVLTRPDSSVKKRPRIFNAMKALRTYASTGHKSYLRVEFGDAVMGEEIDLPPGTPLRVFAVASGIARPDRARFVRLQIWRDGKTLVHDQEVDTEELNTTWTDPEPPLDDAYHPYYVELFHDDFHLSWSTPIWVRYRSP